MELTWIAIAASLLMGGGALLIFIWAVRSHQFQSFEDVKYQVFWSDQEIPVKKRETPKQEQKNGSDGRGNQANRAAG
jgi:cbb3-type cytochrome oxidase maturation protein